MRITCLAGLLVALAATAALADIPPQEIKWSQLPDMNLGLDYSSEIKVPSTVADDWLCNDPRPVTDIHWWGSYWIPGLPTPPDGSPNSDGFPNAPAGGIQSFRIGIWTDVPAGTGVPFSHPGQLLWTVEAASYNEVYFGTTNGGKEVWQYNVYLPQSQWFHQTPGTIYWLSIEALMPDPMRQWGWHESKGHWNDDSVQQFKGSPWYELVNNTYSVDMAFELSVPEPTTMTLLSLGGLALMSKRRR